MRIAIATLVGTISYFLFGWLVFEALLGGFMAEHTTALIGFRKAEGEASMLALLLSCVAYALLLSVVFARWAPVTSFRTGLLRGAVVGTLVACMTDLYWYATSHFFNNLVPVAVDVLAAALTVGAMGGAIGWCLGATAKWR